VGSPSEIKIIFLIARALFERAYFLNISRLFSKAVYKEVVPLSVIPCIFLIISFNLKYILTLKFI